MTENAVKGGVVVMNDISFRNISADEYEQYKEWQIKDYANNMLNLESPDNYLLITQTSHLNKCLCTLKIQ